MWWLKLLGHICTLGIPAIIAAIAKARRKRREQEARLKQTYRLAEARARARMDADKRYPRKVKSLTETKNLTESYQSKVKKIAGEWDE